MNEPFGRQLKPVTVTISGGDPEDRDYWQSNINSYLQHRPCVTLLAKTASNVSIGIFPDANND